MIPSASTNNLDICLYTISLRNIPLLYYCTEYGIFRYHVKAWTRFFGTRFDKRWRFGAAYKRRIHFHVTRRTKNKNKNTFAFAYPVDLSTPPCSTNTDQCCTDQETVIREGAFLILVCGITLPVENLFIKHWFVVSRFR